MKRSFDRPFSKQVEIPDLGFCGPASAQSKPADKDFLASSGFEIATNIASRRTPRNLKRFEGSRRESELQSE